MTEHAAPETSPAPQPVAISQAVNALVVALVSAGWFTLDSAVINALITIIGAIVVIATTLKARASVTAHRP